MGGMGGVPFSPPMLFQLKIPNFLLFVYSIENNIVYATLLGTVSYDYETMMHSFIIAASVVHTPMHVGWEIHLCILKIR